MVGALNQTVQSQAAEIAELKETIAKIRGWARDVKDEFAELQERMPKKKKPGGGRASSRQVTTQELEEVYQLMRKKSGNNYQVCCPNGKRTAAALQLAARLREGYTVEQCKGVIAQRWREWGADDKMRDYFRPQTLFRPSKFAAYVEGLGSE
jgi:uncharacterized phage protein (TIGR02220 family)